MHWHSEFEENPVNINLKVFSIFYSQTDTIVYKKICFFLSIYLTCWVKWGVSLYIYNIYF